MPTPSSFVAAGEVESTSVGSRLYGRQRRQLRASLAVTVVECGQQKSVFVSERELKFVGGDAVS